MSSKADVALFRMYMPEEPQVLFSRAVVVEQRLAPDLSHSSATSIPLHLRPVRIVQRSFGDQSGYQRTGKKA